MAVAAFWLALAAVLIASRWKAKHLEALRHETVRLVIQKKDLDFKEIRELLYPPPPPMPPCPPGHPWARPEPARTYSGLRMAGSILMIGAIGAGALLSAVLSAIAVPHALLLGVAGGIFFFMVGVALFYSARFVDLSQGDASQGS